MEDAERERTSRSLPTKVVTPRYEHQVCLRFTHILQHTTFPLFKLPAELWIRICRLAAVPDEPTMEIEDPEDITEIEHAVQQPAITRTSKAVRAETIHHFYNEHAFRFRHRPFQRLTGLFACFEAMAAVERWADVKNCYITTCQNLRPYLCVVWERKAFLSSYRIRLIALEGEVGDPDLTPPEALTFKLEIKWDEELATLKGEDHKAARQRKTVSRDDNGD